MRLARYIRGASGGKGGGGSARTPIEAADSLRSLQVARVVDIICEGPTYGLANGLQSIFYNDTPLQNPDGSFNFQNVVIQSRVGTQDQTYMPGFEGVESEVAVQTEMLYATPVVRDIVNPNVNRVRLTLAIPQLSQVVLSNGDLVGTTVDIAIDVQSGSSGWIYVGSDTVSGKSMSLYERNYDIPLKDLGPAPWQIRMRRVTPDSTTARINWKTFWSSYTEIIDVKMRYPNRAAVGHSIDASQFPSIPKRAFDWIGLIIKVPSNYAPATRTYSGIWDGTFKLSWTTNPAWCFYDMLTDERYGLGKYLSEAQVDKWALYNIGQYCDELVADGFGGVEPRYTCNLYLQTRENAYKVLLAMASIFRGMTYWAASMMTAVADQPSDKVMIYNPSNIIGGQFHYEGSARAARHTVALVSWDDPADRYATKVERVEDEAGIARYGINETEVMAVGCTSRGQAHRLGRWILYTERMETDVCTFSVGLDNLRCAPGQIIETQDPIRAGVRFGGRIISASGVTLVLDAPVNIIGGFIGLLGWAISCVLPDGTVETQPVTSSGLSATLTLQAPFSANPLPYTPWILRSDIIAPQKWRVLQISEKSAAEFDIVAVEHDPTKYDLIEKDIVIEPIPISLLRVQPDGVYNLIGVENLFESSPGVVGNRLTLSWTGHTGLYQVSYSRDNGNPVNLPDSRIATIDIDGLPPDVYKFRVAQVSPLGLVSRPNVLTFQIYGKTAPPAAVSNFTVIKSTGFALAQWDLSADLDVRNGGSIIVRHSPMTSGALWENGIGLEAFPGGQVQGFCSLITGTYMAKAIDASGNYSPTAASFVLTEGMITGFTTVGTSTQHPAFAGAKTNVAVVGAALELDGATLIDSILTNIDSWTVDEALGGITPTGTYEFNAVMDLTTVATRRFEADVSVFAFDTGDEIDARTDDIDSWDSLDGNIINDCDVTLSASITNDDPAGAPVWGPWQPFMVSDYTCRAAKFKLDFASGQSTHNIAVDTLRVHAKIPA